MPPVDAVILSRTEMPGRNFCTSVAVRHGDQWEQARLLRGPGQHFSLDGLGMPPALVEERWVPGRRVTLPGIRLADRPRITHPEDRVVEDGPILLGEMAGSPEFARIVAEFTFQSVESLFPNVIWQGNGKAYVLGDAAHPRSIGYVLCRTIVYVDNEFANVRMLNGRTICAKVKCTGVLRRLRRNVIARHVQHNQRVVRLGLANASDWEGRFSPPRCYVMITGCSQ